MHPSEISTENRVIFFDNLRFLAVLCVVLQHASNAYTHLVWWPVSDNATSVIVEWLRSFIDAFAMPLLFYIAGYFAIPAIKKKGVTTFLKTKLKRLGIPWLICIVTICPILPLTYHYTRNDLTLSMSYWDIWVELMKNAAKFDIGIIYSMSELMQNNQFYQRYMWFLSLLLLFFFVFGVVYFLKSSWFDTVDQPVSSETPSIPSTLKILIIIGFLTFFCSFLMIGTMFLLAPKLSNPEPFFTLGNVIQFRPSRLFLFIIYFILGILIFKKQWIERGKFPGHFRTWFISFVIIIIAFFYARNLMLNGSEHLRNIFGPVFFFFLNFLTISTLGLSTSLALKYWNQPTAINRSLAANSYNIYLAHYLFVIVFQLLLFTIQGMPGLLKFGIVSVLSIMCTYIVSQSILKPFPRISVVLAISLFAGMILIIHP
jgi:fucose 4-O-acetylase-like acetyltransferase